MNCDGVRGLLSAYLDGELLPGDLLRVEQHLRRCHACADEVDSLRQTITLVKSLNEVEAPASFRVSLHERLVGLGPPVPARKVPTARTWQHQLRAWVLPAAAAAAVLAVGVGQWNQMGRTLDGRVVQRPASVELVKQPGGEVELPPAQPVFVPPKNNPAVTGTVRAVDPPVPVTAGKEVPPVNAPPPKVGKLATNLEIHTASLLAGVTEPKSLPARESVSYSLTATVADPAAVAETLQMAFGGQVLPVVGRPGVVTSVVISLPAADVEASLANIRGGLGQNVEEAKPSTADWAASINDAFERLTSLNNQRERVIDSAYGKEDPGQVGAFAVQLDAIAAQAAEQRATYERLQKMVSTVTITVYLQK